MPRRCGSDRRGTGGGAVRSAELVAPRQYLLSGLLRGQAGTDAAIPETWPAGTDFVLLDAAVGQVRLAAAARGSGGHFRIGPVVPFLRRSQLCSPGGDLRGRRVATLSAGPPPGPGAGPIRRSSFAGFAARAIDGDNWAGTDVRWAEEREEYLVRVRRGGGPARDDQRRAAVSSTRRSNRMRTAGRGALTFEVAQVFGRFGPGPFGRIEFDG